MNSSKYLVWLIVLAVVGCTETTEEVEVAGSEEAMSDPCPDLMGSWELMQIQESALALSGEFESDPDYQQAPTLKILNDTHWMFIRQSAQQFVHAQGGRYTLESGGFYTEHVEYSAIPENVGQSFSFECTLEGDSLWHHVGGQGDARYDEVWKRIQ